MANLTREDIVRILGQFLIDESGVDMDEAEAECRALARAYLTNDGHGGEPSASMAVESYSEAFFSDPDEKHLDEMHGALKLAWLLYEGDPSYGAT